VQWVDIAADLCRRFEGLRLRPYTCPAGVPTIGYGHTGGVTLSTPAITLERAEELLHGDLMYAASHAIRLSPRLAESEPRFAAIVDFVLNLGPTRYASSTLRRRVNEQDWDGARIEIRRWVFAGGRKLPGLMLRRETEAALL
jgi:lysozyme